MSRTRKVDSDAGQGTPTGEPTSGILRTACRFSPRRQSTKNRALSAAHVCRVVVLKIAETHPLRYGAGQRSSRGNAARPPPPPPAEVDVEVVILIKTEFPLSRVPSLDHQLGTPDPSRWLRLPPPIHRSMSTRAMRAGSWGWSRRSTSSPSPLSRCGFMSGRLW